MRFRTECQQLRRNGKELGPRWASNINIMANFMKRSEASPWLRRITAISFSLLVAFSADGQNIRTQTLNLKKGWNAVCLQVDPTNSKPSDCFRGTPVSIVASYVADKTLVQFVQNPSTNTLNKDNGWAAWYAADRPDAFLTTLFNLNANGAYLLYCQNDFTWSVSGSVVPAEIKWKPNSFNLAGFCLDDVSPPTFAQFFQPSAAHLPIRIYRLNNSQWSLVDQPQTTQMRSGEAYWVFCQGTSDYQGPLGIKMPNGQKLLVNGVNPTGVLFANRTGNPLEVRIEKVTGSAELPLAFVLRVATENNIIAASYDLPTIYNMPTFEANENRGFWLTVRPEKMTNDTATALLKITTDIGTQSWLPLVGNRSELQSN